MIIQSSSGRGAVTGPRIGANGGTDLSGGAGSAEDRGTDARARRFRLASGFRKRTSGPDDRSSQQGQGFLPRPEGGCVG